MQDLTKLNRQALQAYAHEMQEAYQAFLDKHLSINMARGKPAPEQLDLSDALFSLGRDQVGVRSADGIDCRNYGDLCGIPECRALFGDRCDVDAAFSEKIHLWETDQNKVKVRDIYSYVHEETEKKNADPESRFDIEQLEDLYYWENEDDTMSPDVEEFLKRGIRRAWDIGEEHRKRFQAMSREERIDYMARRSHRGPILLESVWRDILDRIMDDDYILRYVVLLVLDVSNSSAYTFINALTLKPALMEYCWRHAFEGETESEE